MKKVPENGGHFLKLLGFPKVFVDFQKCCGFPKVFVDFQKCCGFPKVFGVFPKVFGVFEKCEKVKSHNLDQNEKVFW
jgi:hypothetical protein